MRPQNKVYNFALDVEEADSCPVNVVLNLEQDTATRRHVRMECFTVRRGVGGGSLVRQRDIDMNKHRGH